MDLSSSADGPPRGRPIRGAVADPLLARRIRGGAGEETTKSDWCEIEAMVGEFWARVQCKVLPGQSPGCLNQWLGLIVAARPLC